MDKRKSKNDQPRVSEPDKGGGEFWGVWIFSQTVLLLLLWLLVGSYERLPYPFFTISTFITAFVLIEVFTLAATTLQQTTGERFLRFSMKNWAFVSGLGTALSLVAYVMAHPMGLLPSALALFMPTALAQMLWLRSHVFFAWLWPLAHLVGIVLFVETWLPQRDWATLLLAPLQAIIYTIVIRHLFAQHDPDKLKAYLTRQKTFDQARVQRLEEQDANGTFEAVEDGERVNYEGR